MRGSDFSPLVASLSLLAVDSITYDNLYVGQGPRPSSLSILEQALHGWKTIDSTLGIGSQVHLFGISMGGMIAATMATLAPTRVLSLSLGATSPNTGEIPAIPDELYVLWTQVATAQDLYNSVEIAFGETTIREHKQIVDEYFNYRLKKENGQSRSEFVRQLDSIRAFSGEVIYPDLKRTNLDSMLISGDEDRLFPEVHSKYIEHHVRRRIRLPNTGHMLHLENPQELASILAERVGS
jgi:pimeloyl-ACP methyl ester carboxylesterase